MGGKIWHEILRAIFFRPFRLNDVLISYWFEGELNTVVTFLPCWFARPTKKSLIHVENTRKLNFLNISPDFFSFIFGPSKKCEFLRN